MDDQNWLVSVGVGLVRVCCYYVYYVTEALPSLGFPTRSGFFGVKVAAIRYSGFCNV